MSHTSNNATVQNAVVESAVDQLPNSMRSSDIPTLIHPSEHRVLPKIGTWKTKMGSRDGVEAIASSSLQTPDSVRKRGPINLSRDQGSQKRRKTSPMPPQAIAKKHEAGAGVTAPSSIKAPVDSLSQARDVVQRRHAMQMQQVLDQPSVSIEAESESTRSEGNEVAELSEEAKTTITQFERLVIQLENNKEFLTWYYQETNDLFKARFGAGIDSFLSERVRKVLPADYRNVTKEDRLWRHKNLLQRSRWAVDEEKLGKAFGSEIFDSLNTIHELVKLSMYDVSFGDARDLILIERQNRLRDSSSNMAVICPRDVTAVIEKLQNRPKERRGEMSDTTEGSHLVNSGAGTDEKDAITNTANEKRTRKSADNSNSGTTNQNHEPVPTKLHRVVEYSISSRGLSVQRNHEKGDLESQGTILKIGALNNPEKHPELDHPLSLDNSQFMSTPSQLSYATSIKLKPLASDECSTIHPKPGSILANNSTIEPDNPDRVSLQVPHHAYDGAKEGPNAIPRLPRLSSVTGSPQREVFTDMPILNGDDHHDDTHSKLAEDFLSSSPTASLTNRPLAALAQIVSAATHVDDGDGKIPSTGTHRHIDTAVFPATTIDGAISSLLPMRWLSCTAIQELLLKFAGCHSSNIHIVDAAYLDTVNPQKLLSKHPMRTQNAASFLIPLNLQSNHWALGQIDVSARQINIFDSFKVLGCAETAEAALRSFVAHLARSENIPKDATWTFNEQPCPQQENSYDCGIFCIMVAVHLLVSVPLPRTFDQASCSLWRLVGTAILGEEPPRSYFGPDVATKNIPLGSATLENAVTKLQAIKDEAISVHLASKKFSVLMGCFRSKTTSRITETKAKIARINSQIAGAALTIPVTSPDEDDTDAAKLMEDFVKWKNKRQKAKEIEDNNAVVQARQSRSITRISTIVNHYTFNATTTRDIVSKEIMKILKEADAQNIEKIAEAKRLNDGNAAEQEELAAKLAKVKKQMETAKREGLLLEADIKSMQARALWIKKVKAKEKEGLEG